MPVHGHAQQDLRDAVKQFDSGEIEEARARIAALSREGHPGAQVFLGWLHETGRGVPIDKDEALYWYGAAANAGDAVGQYYLAVLTIRRGDLRGGVHWLEQAAKQRYVPALYRLGKMHEAGYGVERSEVECRRWITEAASLGHPFAQRWLAIRGLRGAAGVRGFFRALAWFASLPFVSFRLAWRDESDENLTRP